VKPAGRELHIKINRRGCRIWSVRAVVPFEKGKVDVAEHNKSREKPPGETEISCARAR